MNIVFQEPRLKLTAAGEIFVRVVVYSTYAVLGAATPILLLSDIAQLKWVGVILVLFLGDRLIHIHHGEKSLHELEKRIARGKDINVANALTPAAIKDLTYSYRKSFALGKDFHLILFHKLSQRREVKEMLKRIGLDYENIDKKLNEYDGENKENKNQILEYIESIAKESFIQARIYNEKFIAPRNLLAAAAANPSPKLKKLLELYNIEAGDIREAATFGRFRKTFGGIKSTPLTLGGFAHRPAKLRKRIMNRAWTARPTPYLDKFSTDLTALAKKEKIGFLVGHDREFKELLALLTRPAKPNVLLVGEPGTGKSTLIYHLAFRIIKDEVPKTIFDKRLISLDIGDLIADISAEELAGRLKRITEEIILAGNIILFIPNIHNLFKPLGAADKLVAMDILLPVIRSANIPMVGETYPQEFKKYIENQSEFMDQFEVLNIEEVTEEEAVRLLIYQALVLENSFKVYITLKAIKRAVQLAKRYLHKKPLPSSAVDLLKQALVRASDRKEKKLEENIVIEVAEDLSRIPIQKAGDKETERLLNLEELIHERLINQEAAVRAVARAMREYRSGLSRRGGPIAAFLFVGPTGVGKTELAKILAGIQFGSRSAMERLDMSEYQDRQSIYRLIGLPDGSKTGALTDAVLQKPYTLILLDEFEKSHPDVLNIFLQVFDDGRLTDSLGRTVDFENTIIIATSNAHSDFIKESIEGGKKIEDIAEELKTKLTHYFKPELLNRFSDVMVFRNLDQEEIAAIAKILIGELREQLKDAHGIELVVEDSAVREIARRGYSPVFGARPLRGAISENIKSVLAEKILKKEIARGNVVKISYPDHRFEFKVIE